MTSGIFASKLTLVLTGLWVLTLFQPMVDAVTTEYPDNVHMSFSLYTRGNVEEPEITYFQENETLTFKSFEPSKKTLVAIHGHSEENPQSVTPFYKALVPKFTEMDMNLIMVNWTELAKDINKLVLMANTDYVGRRVAKMIRILRKLATKVEPIHVLGLENGCIVGAVAAHNLADEPLEKFTVLDPPHQLMFEASKWNKISKYSADLVEAVHTCGRLIGTLEPVGHRDFYANGGTWPQNGCGPDKSGKCSVYVSLDSYIDSIDYRIEATNCESYKNYEDHRCLEKTKIRVYNNYKLHEIPQGKYFYSYSKGVLEVRRSFKNTDSSRANKTKKPNETKAPKNFNVSKNVLSRKRNGGPASSGINLEQLISGEKYYG